MTTPAGTAATSTPDDATRIELARILGGLLVAAGALALWIRKDAHDEWGDFGRLLVLAIPGVVLYLLGLGMVGSRRLQRGPSGEPAQSVLLVLGVVFAPLALAQFVDAIGGDSGASLNVTWIFLVTAGLALYAAFTAGVAYGGLLGALALLVAWLAFWDEALDPSATTVRWLLVIIAALFVYCAVRLEQRALTQATEFVTAAGLAALAAGVLGLISLAAQFIGQSLSAAFGTTAEVGGAQQHQEWDLFLLVVALALIWYGARRGARGPTYVGAVTLLAFIVSVGIEIVALFSGGSRPEGDLFGWPLLLLLVGGAALVAGFREARPAPDGGGSPPLPSPGPTA